MIVIDFLFALAGRWLALLGGPLLDPTMLWILVPTYFTWLITELFQEKHGATISNAITNSVVPIFVGWDWTRTIYTRLTDASLSLGWQTYTKIGLALAMLVYGIHILIEGIKLRKRAQFIGRIRVVTYVVLMLTPLYYGSAPFDFVSFIAMIVFFPIFYFVIELIDRLVPDSAALEEPAENKAVKPATRQPALPARHHIQQSAAYPHPYPPAHYYRHYGVQRR